LGASKLAILDVGIRERHPVFLEAAAEHRPPAIAGLDAAVAHDGEPKTTTRLAEATFRGGDFMHSR
jgi:hypothetical protein